eukprot:scaffold84108_cov27-Tisochrysis_lutea.AAC.6
MSRPIVGRRRQQSGLAHPSPRAADRSASARSARDERSRCQAVASRGPACGHGAQPPPCQERGAKDASGGSRWRAPRPHSAAWRAPPPGGEGSLKHRPRAELPQRGAHALSTQGEHRLARGRRGASSLRRLWAERSVWAAVRREREGGERERERRGAGAFEIRAGRSALASWGVCRRGGREDEREEQGERERGGGRS